MAILQIDSTPIDENELKQNKQIHYTSHWKPQLFLSAESVQHFKCVQCGNIPKLSHECDKGHLFCEYCIKTSIKSNQLCTISQHKITIAKENIFASNIIKDLKIKCIHSIMEIDASIEGNIDDTKQQVPYAMDECCKWIGIVKDMDTHLKQNCRIQKYIDHQAKFHQLEQQNILFKQQLDTLQINIKQSNQQNKSLNQIIQTKTNEISSLNQSIQTLKSQIQSHDIIHKQQTAENKKLQIESEHKINENKALKKHINDLETKLKQIQNENNTLNIQINAYDNFKQNDNNDEKQDDFKLHTQQKYQSIPISVLCVEKDKTETLESHDQIIYDIHQLILQENAVLTIKAWDPDEKQGGFLNIRVKTNIIMKQGSKISVSGLGYKGGKYKGMQGESYICIGKISTVCNNGGGGGGGGSISAGHGGGGSYGSKGHHGWNDMMGSQIGGGKSGEIYNDETLEILYRGSGGGCSGLNNYYGGNGGGIIQIECNGIIIMEKDAVIEANGMDGHINGGGGGSGGSIRIVSNSIKMDNSWWTKCGISAKGGDANVEKAGKGGDGRICCLIQDTTQIQKQNIIPAPFCG